MDCLRIEKKKSIFRKSQERGQGYKYTNVFSKEKGKRFTQKRRAGMSCTLQVRLMGQAPQKTVGPHHFSPSYGKFY